MQGLSKLEYYKRRFRRAYSIYTQWISLLQVCYHYCIPYRDLYYYTNQLQGTQKNAKVYDTTGVAATNNFVSKIHMALTPPQTDWAFLDAGTEIPEDQKEEINLVLQEQTSPLNQINMQCLIKPGVKFETAFWAVYCLVFLQVGKGLK